ncbi:MAG: HTH-type transcriptional regulator CdhR [Herbaspirillum frisingense]|uniref:HTH-type transcriptional regulator CdhR n=1 Tax=Herbaspirillum frisingense TaxID=92645 RepID=A0A7V8G037_9BURK|nr:MAG: HTH-type transcriptional regulator CdhR [Herbaspirillum frisingense]
MPKRIAFVVFPGFQILDLAAMTVFEMANLELGEAYYQTELVSLEGGMVASSAGVRVETLAMARRPADTVMVGGALDVPGGMSELTEQLRKAAARARRTASICTGAFLLAEAGLLDGRRATTHWAHALELRARHPLVQVDEDRIFVNDGGVWTSAGMTACIDLALALVDADLGAQTARSVSRKMVVYHRRTGGQSQFSTLSEMEPASDRIRDALSFAKEHLREPLTIEQLAAHVHWSPRHFSRAFQLQTGYSPAKAVEKLRLEAAKALIEAGHNVIAAIAADTGFGDEERMRRAFLRAFGKPPQAMVREVRARHEAREALA